MGIRPLGAELFHADGRTDMTKLIVALHNFVNETNNQRRKLLTPDCSQKTNVFAEEITVLLDTCE
jgi:hypothetical protein